MTPELLSTIGVLLFGQQWHTDMASEVNVSPRTIRRWAAGTSPVPDGVRKELFALMRVRLKEIRAALTENKL